MTFKGFTGLGGALATSIAELPPPAGKSAEPPLGQPVRINEKVKIQTTTETLALRIVYLRYKGSVGNLYV
jgi:hypothetical protein